MTRKDDSQIGMPFTVYKDTATNFGSISSVEGMEGYSTDLHLLGYYNGTQWVFRNNIPAGGSSTQMLQWISSSAAKWISVSGDISIADGGTVTLSASSVNLTTKVTGILGGNNGGTGVSNAGKTLTLGGASTTINGGGTISLGGYTLTVAGTASIIGTLSAGAYTLTVNQNLTLGGASGKSLTLTNSLTNQGGNDGILSWSGAYTLTIPATGTVALLGTAQTFTAVQTDTLTDSGTATVVYPVIIGHNSSGTPAANFGSGLKFQAHTSTTTNTDISVIQNFWTTATHASRASMSTMSAIDYAATREVIRYGANGSAGVLGFFGVTAVPRVSTYTQTYSASAKTVTAITAAALTAASGTASQTISDVGTSFSQTTLNNNFKSSASQINAIITDVTNLYKVQNAVINDLKSYGLLQ